MVRKSITFTALAATLALAFSPVAANAHDRDDRHDDWRNYQDDDRRHGHDRRDDRRDDRRFAQRYDQRYDQRFDQRGYRYGGDYRQQIRGGGYGQPRGYYADTNYQRGFGNRCRGNRSTGTIVGAIAGGLLGNSVAGRGDRLLGTVLGGGVGAVAGRAIDRGNDRC